MATALLFVTLGLTLLGSSAALNADPTCSTGILEESALVCCAKECTRCGGPSCGNLPGGSTDCCIASVEKADKPCSKNNPPCMLAKPTPVDPPTACGFYPEPLSTTQPNVLLIGDSISMPVPFTPGGYGAPVHDMLTNEGIAAQHNGGWGSGGQASNTVKGLECTDSKTQGNWLNVTRKYDVIHFNFGLHDLVDAGPGEGKEHVEIPQYGQNLVTIYNRLAAKAKHVIWTSTTPCPNVTTSMGRTDAKVVAYNAQALASLKQGAAGGGAGDGGGLLVDDLYSAVDGYCGKNYKSCDLQLPKNVHFTTDGCLFMAERVAKSILIALNRTNTSLEHTLTQTL